MIGKNCLKFIARPLFASLIFRKTSLRARSQGAQRARPNGAIVPHWDDKAGDGAILIVFLNQFA